MGEEIFRQKSLEKIKSPESLNDYVRVANPGVWLLLISVIVLFAGTCIWGIFGHIDHSAAAEIQVENGAVICYVDEEIIAEVEPGMPVKFADMEGTITEAGKSDARGYVCSVQMDSVPADGTYSGEIVLQRFKPISFILN